MPNTLHVGLGHLRPIDLCSVNPETGISRHSGWNSLSHFEHWSIGAIFSQYRYIIWRRLDKPEQLMGYPKDWTKVEALSLAWMSGRVCNNWLACWWINSVTDLHEMMMMGALTASAICILSTIPFVLDASLIPMHFCDQIVVKYIC